MLDGNRDLTILETDGGISKPKTVVSKTHARYDKTQLVHINDINYYILLYLNKIRLVAKYKYKE